MKTNKADAELTAEQIEALKKAALAATPQKIDGAESIDRYEDGSHYECPACGGEGSVPRESDFCNYDGEALGVQFYGVGDAVGTAEAYFRAAKPANVLALIARLERAEAARAESPVADAQVEPFPYQKTFDAIAAATNVVAGAYVGISVIKFREAFGAAPVVAQTASMLPAWFDTFIQNICELPDRNSPEDEPEAIVATPEELRNCALNAIEQGASHVPDALHGDNSAWIEARRSAPVVAQAEAKDSARLDLIASEYLTVTAFTIAYEDDADVGWRVTQSHIDVPHERVVAEIHHDDLRTVLDAASDALKPEKTHQAIGAGIDKEWCVNMAKLEPEDGEIVAGVVAQAEAKVSDADQMNGIDRGAALNRVVWKLAEAMGRVPDGTKVIELDIADLVTAACRILASRLALVGWLVAEGGRVGFVEAASPDIELIASAQPRVYFPIKAHPNAAKFVLSAIRRRVGSDNVGASAVGGDRG